MKMKRYFSLLLALVLMFALAVPVSAETTVPTVTVESKNDVVYKAGDTVELDVSIANNTGYTSFNFEVVYDHTQLELVEFVTADGEGKQYIPAGIFQTNGDKFVFANTNDIKANGTMFKLKFKVLSAGVSAPANVRINVAEFYSDGTPVASTFVSGGAKVVGTTTGSVSDATKIANPTIIHTNIDANGDIKYTTPGDTTASNPSGSNNKLDETPVFVVNGVTLPVGTFVIASGDYAGKYMLPNGVILGTDGTVAKAPDGSSLPTGSTITAGGNYRHPTNGSILTAGGQTVGDGTQDGDPQTPSKPTLSITTNGNGKLNYPDGTSINVTNRTKQEGEANRPAIGVDSDTGKLVVSFSKACMVLIKDKNGNYTVVEAEQNDDGSYSFNISGVTADDEIIVAVKGDYNGDGVVTAGDLLLASKNTNTMDELQKTLMDYDGKNGVTAGDLLLISKHTNDMPW